MIIDATNLVTNPAGNRPQDPAQVIGIAIHHTVGVNFRQTEEEERATIRRIDLQHVAQNFGGFGYHGIVFPSGRVYHCGEGQRAHVEKRNHELRGWAFSGTFTTEQPTQAAWDGMHEALMWELGHYYKGVEVRGHREWTLPGTGGTVCPGVIVPFDWQTWLTPPVPAPYVTYNKIGFSDGTEWFLEVKPPPQ